MVGLILGVLAVYFIYIVAPPSLQYLTGSKPVRAKLSVALGPRDEPPDPPRAARRAARAQRNFEESLPFFLAFALLLLQLGKADGLGLVGAQIFLVARIIYLPAYLSGAPGLRSALWVAGATGLIVMLVPVLAP